MKKLMTASSAEKSKWLQSDLNDIEEELNIPPDSSTSVVVRRMGAALAKFRLRKVATRRWFQATRQLSRMVRVWTTLKVLTSMEREVDKKKRLEESNESTA